MNFSGNKKKLILSLIIFAQVNQPLQAGIMDWIKSDRAWHFRVGILAIGAIVGSSILTAFLVRKFQHSPSQNPPIQHPPAEQNSPIRNNAAEIHNKIALEQSEKLEKDIKAKLSYDLEKKIYKINLKEAEMHAYALRAKLIPAVVELQSPWVMNVLDYFTIQHQDLLKQYMSQSEAVTALRDKIATKHKNKPIALFGYILSQRHNNWHQQPASQHIAIKNFLEEQVQHSDHLLFKNEIHPTNLLKTALLPAEVAFVGYSDGDIRIMLNDADRRSLANLSDEQRDFITGLYRHKIHTKNQWDEGLKLGPKQIAIFNTLSSSHKNNLLNFYNLKT